jgi:hypothetical protein
MKRNFDFHIDKRTKILTALTIIIFLGGAVLLYFLYTGGFLSAWFTSLVLAITALMVLSVPRKVVVLDSTLEIQCISDISEIEIADIESVKVVSKREMRWTLPIFAAMGFFGYYGKFIDLKEFDLVSIYASEWNNFVEITDIYDSRTYISCRDADQLIEAIKQAQNTIAKQMEQDDKSGDSLTLHSYWE